MMNKFENIKFSDLEIIELLAQTHQSNTKIYVCRYDSQIYVCKAISKQSLKTDAKGVEHVYNQKNILQHFTNQNCNSRICKIFGTFQDELNIYLMLEMIQGLPLHKLLKMMGKLKIQFVKLITAQVALIMQNFHSQGFIYRDIKSSNFMVNSKGVVSMIDLGKAKRINKQRTYTICGTAHAIPPEVKNKKGFGVLIYELIVGNPPFGYGNSNKQIVIDIQNGLTCQIIDKMSDSDAKNLVQSLMNNNAAQRLGSKQGFRQILEHQFFGSQRVTAVNIWKGEQELSEYDDSFYEQISEIIDFGIDWQKYQQITEDDPFYQFL